MSSFTAATVTEIGLFQSSGLIVIVVGEVIVSALGSEEDSTTVTGAWGLEASWNVKVSVPEFSERTADVEVTSNSALLSSTVVMRIVSLVMPS